MYIQVFTDKILYLKCGSQYSKNKQTNKKLLGRQ